MEAHPLTNWPNAKWCYAKQCYALRRRLVLPKRRIMAHASAAYDPPPRLAPKLLP